MIIKKARKKLETTLGYSFQNRGFLQVALADYMLSFISDDEEYKEIYRSFRDDFLPDFTIKEMDHVYMIRERVFAVFRSIVPTLPHERIDQLIEYEKFILSLVKKFSIHQLSIIEDKNILFVPLAMNLVFYLIEAIERDCVANLTEDDYQQWLHSIMPGYQLPAQLVCKTEDSGRVLNLANPERYESIKPNLNRFNERFLSYFSVDKLHEKFPLKELPDVMEEGFDEVQINRFYRQFIPYLLEVVRNDMQQEYDKIEEKKSTQFQVTFSHFVSDDATFSVECVCETDKLPELDHAFSLEAVLIVGDPAEGKEPQRRFLAIARRGIEKVEGGPEKKRVINLYIIIPSHLKSLYPEYFTDGINWRVHWLTSLISISRMFEVCVQSPRVNFLRSLMFGKLPDWPEILEQDEGPLHSLVNKSQWSAIRSFQAAKEGVYLLQGPPGTGKTRTIIHLLQTLVSDEPRNKILVCAPSNKAIREIAIRTVSDFPELLVGVMGTAKDVPEQLRAVFVTDFTAIRATEIKKEKERLIPLCEEALEVVRAQKIPIRPKTNKLYEQVKVMYELLDKQKQELSCLFRRLNFSTAEERGRFHGIVRRYRFEKMDQALKQFNEIFSEYFDAKRSQKPRMRFDRFQKDLQKRLDQFQENFDAHLVSLQDKVNSDFIEEIMIKSAQVIFSTLVSSGSKRLYKHLAQVASLIVDEATQSVKPEMLIPLRYDPTKCLLVGDTRQLRPTVTSALARKQKFDHAFMFSLLESQNGTPFRMLELQYRMHPAICEFPSRKNYRSQLKSAKGLEERPSPLSQMEKVGPRLRKPCLFFDIAGEEDRQHGPSIENEIEAKALVCILGKLLKYLEPEQIGVIAFYIAQVELIRQLLLSKSPQVQKKAEKVVISTVDGFQGSERDVILLSTVRTGESVGFLSEAQRVNVALTRAKHHLYLFGNESTLSQSNSDFRPLLQFYKEEKEADSDYQIIQRVTK